MKNPRSSEAPQAAGWRGSGAATKRSAAFRFPSGSGGAAAQPATPAAPAPTNENNFDWRHRWASAWRAICEALNLREHRRRKIDAGVAAALDGVLTAESSALRARNVANPLAFHPTEYVRPRQYGIRCLRPRRIELIRTIAKALDDGYRVRVRAFARGAAQRVIVRTIEVDLPRAR